MGIAFLGLGRMGRILARHLVDDGHEVTVWNRSAAPAEELAAAGARRASTPEEAVRGANGVITAFFGPDAVRDVVIDQSLPIEGVWVDVTTVSPADAAVCAAWAGDAGIDYVHSPVIGSLKPASARSLTVLTGGDVSDRVREIVSTWATNRRVREYETAAEAAGGKLIANLALASTAQAMVEALRLGEAAGFTNEAVIDLLADTTLAPIAAMKGEIALSESFADTQFSTNLLFKDVALMLATSERPLPALTTVYEALAVAREHGHGEDDFASIMRGHGRR